MILVSACLLGDNCKYDGGNNYQKKVQKFLEGKEYLKVCPECLGGLTIPRIPSERKKEKVFNQRNEDVTKEFYKGRDEVLKLIEAKKIELAILKSKSPSCGYKLIYDGTFQKKLCQGNGILTDALLERKIRVITENDL